MKRTCLMVLVLVGLFATLPASWVSAMPVDAAGLRVTLTNGPLVVAQSVTDDSGVFLLEGVAAGSYRLNVADDAATVTLSFAISVAPEEEPASVAGDITVYPDVEAGVKAMVRVVGQDQAEDLLVDRVGLSPRKWNRNFAKSQGQVKAVLHGLGLDAVTMVTLQNESGSISSAEITWDEEEGVAKARFRKSEAYGALVPDGTPRGTVVPVEIILNTPAGSETHSGEILILGKKK